MKHTGETMQERVCEDGLQHETWCREIHPVTTLSMDKETNEIQHRLHTIGAALFK